MTECTVPEDINEANERSLSTLQRSIEKPQEFTLKEFSLTLSRCSYTDLSRRIIDKLKIRLHEKAITIREIDLPRSVKTLFTTIQNELGHEQPQALIINGLGFVSDIEEVLVATNQVREEFKKKFPFPVVIWVDSSLLHKLNRLAPDFKSWGATSIKFEETTENLIDLLNKSADRVFAEALDKGATNRFWNSPILDTPYLSELLAAQKDLSDRGTISSPQQVVELEFTLGIDCYEKGEYDSAIEHFQSSLEFWQAPRQSVQAIAEVDIPKKQCAEREGVLLFYIGQCYYEKAKRLKPNSEENDWQEAKRYLQQSIDTFERADPLDLVARFISKLGEVLERLELWTELQILTNRCFELHRRYDDLKLHLAQDYGWQATLHLQEQKWSEAKKNADMALELLSEISEIPLEARNWFRSRFLLSLARSQQGLEQIDDAIASLELARILCVNLRRPWISLQILKALQEIYRIRGEYLKAFEAKQELLSVEQQYALRAFIGAVRLKPQQQVDREEVAISQEILYSGRQQDLDNLIKRMGRPDLKLTVIHGQSGVGKSSLLNAGLLPALNQTPIGGRMVFPVLLNSYTDWIETLGKELSVVGSQLKEAKEINGNRLWTVDKVFQLLHYNDAHNLTTVLIFDQFEEFFFFCATQAQRMPFWQFLKTCLRTNPYVKVIFSLREDYLHFLLECDRLVDLEVVNNNILDKNFRYYLGNFSKEDAKRIIKELTDRSQTCLEDALIDAIVNDLAREQGEVLPIELQVVGAQLQAEKPPITTLEQYRALGENAKEELVRRYLDEVIKDCGSKNKEIAELVLYYLTDEKGTRPLKTRAELERDLSVLTKDLVGEMLYKEISSLELVLDIFVKSGLVLLLREVPAEQYQLVHDYLAAFIHRQQEPKLNELVAALESERKKLQEAELQNRLSKEKLRRGEKRRNVLIGWGFAVTMLAVTLGGIAFHALSLREELFVSLSKYSRVLSDSNRNNEGLTESLKLSQQLRKIPIFLDKHKTQLRVALSLQQALSRVSERNRLDGHINDILSVGFSPDDRTIATGSADKTVILWDPSGQFMKKLEGHEASVRSVGFSLDSKTIVTGGGDGTVIVWDASTAKVKKKLSGHTDSIYSVRFSRDGKTTMSVGADGEIRLWDIDGNPKKTFKAEVSLTTAIFSHDGRLIAYAGNDGKIVVRDLNDWDKVISEIKPQGQPSPVKCMSFSNDSKMLVAGYENKQIKLWDSFTAKEIDSKFKGHASSISSISFSPDGKTIASASENGRIKLWDVNGTELKAFRAGVSIKSLVFSHSGKMLVSGGDGATAWLWDLEGASKLITKHDKIGINSFSFNFDGTHLISGSSDGTVTLWNLDKKGNLKISSRYPHNSKAKANSAIVDFSRDGRSIWYAINYTNSNKNDEAIIYFKDISESYPRALPTIKNTSITGLKISPDGKTILVALTAKDENKVMILDRENKQLLYTLTEHTGAIQKISFNPTNDQMFATASADKTVRLWNSSDKKLIRTLAKHTSIVFDVKFSPDGQTIATASADNTVKLWRSSDGNEIATLRGHKDSVYSVSFSPDGKILASAGADSKVRLWDLEDKVEIGAFDGHFSGINTVGFKPHQNDELKYLLVSTGRDGAIVWNLDLDHLTNVGCRWLADYLKTHPQEKEGFNICEESKRS